MKKLELKGIKHSFKGKKGDVPVLANIDLHVEQGEFVSIIGPSGSGKSTLFHIIGGLIQPDVGEVHLNGAKVTGKRGLVSYMPQQPALFSLAFDRIQCGPWAGSSRRRPQHCNRKSERVAR